MHFKPLLVTCTSILLSITHAHAHALPSSETWLIPRLTLHMMTSTTNMPGNPPWPPSQRFNTTIDFDILMPDHYYGAATPAADGDDDVVQFNCRAEWENGTLPNTIAFCDAIYDGFGVRDGDETEVVGFWMNEWDGLGDTREELSFELGVGRIWGDGVDDWNARTGSAFVTANNPSEPTSYLTCVQGAPLSGLTCNIKSYMSTQNELIIEGMWDEREDENMVYDEGKGNALL